GHSSGSARHITPEVSQSLRQCDSIAGYKKYVDMIRPYTRGKQIIENGMRGEIDRCKETLDAALTGSNVCMVCSGDAGILAMAGLLYEIQAAHEKYSELEITVLPGITAANIAASTVGAPLQNGYSLISLSNLLVPTEEVENNLLTISKSHLTCALYNPAGRKRRDLLHRAVEIFLEARGQDTLCSLVHHAGRDCEKKWIGNLTDLDLDSVDMSSLLIIGGSRARVHNGIFFENRGYEDKYGK
ncbi:MAG: precorrin-3B C(17)-methyltransferase, partial [Planctomycetaceae bacterium]|nr:precorrin-3B C(17)-methyltransferase [Planctomycetaceae bacterium]